MEKIKIGVIGFGNVGKAILRVASSNPDMEIVGIFTKREPDKLSISNVPVFHVENVKDFSNKIDVMVLCTGSATDLPVQGPEIAKMFNTIDSFDTHKTIPEYFASMDASSKYGNKVSVISAGWDPGLFSINRLYGEAFLSNSKTYTFWGPGVSQGHSQAVRSINGVKDAIQYTVPVEEALEVIRSGDTPDFTTREKHIRVCYVVAKEDANKKLIEQEIKNMPNYFSDYDTTVNFISEEEFNKEHIKMPHGGFVITSGNTTKENKITMEFSFKAESNPEITASIMLSYARAAYRLYKKGELGAKTVFDIAPNLLSPKNPNELIKDIM